MAFKRVAVSTALVAAFALLVACGGNVSHNPGHAAGGNAGTGATGGNAGAGATGGNAGYAGSAGIGGYAGSAGIGGYAGSAGIGGYAGSAGIGGYAGAAGTQGQSCASNPSSCILPPPPSSQPPNTTGTKTVIAVSKLFLGDTNKQGSPDPNAWRSFGYNLDGLISTKNDLNHCQPVPGANPADVKTDGDGGIDNSFGENVLPLLLSLASDVSASMNLSIANGAFTELFRLDNLTLAPNQNGVTAALYAGADKGSPALFDGTDIWPVTYESVVNGNLNAAKVTFPNSYVVGSVWVSGGKANLTLPFSVQGYPLPVPINDAVVTMQLKGTGTNATAVNGTIAGVIDTQAMIAAMKKVAGSFDASLCDGPTFDSIAQQFRAASDIMADGTNGDPGKTCNAISIGIGFDGHAVNLGAVAPPVTPLPDPCAP